jgi:DNA-binding protein YbaB
MLHHWAARPSGTCKVGYRVNDEFQAQMEDKAADFRERLSQVRELRQQLSSVTASARSRDGMIGVEVGAQGQLRGIWLDPGLFDRSSPQRLAAAIVELSGIATAEAARKVQEIMAPVLPSGSLPADGDLMSLMPQAPGTDNRPPW